MPEIITTNKVKSKKDLHRKSDINWDKLSYAEMVKKVEELAGPKPNLPKDLPVVEWSTQAMQVLRERYFLKNEKGEVIENVSEMCWRVAWELARSEVKFGKSRQEVIAYARTYYELMMSRQFLPNSPTLMNAGKNNGLQYSACYVLPVEDSLEGIFDGVKYQAIIHQSGGGTGFSFSRLRPTGSRVKSTMGVASGPVSFMRIYNEATQQIKQGGMRRGANMGILRVDHPDVMEFIHCKDDNVSISNFNISVTATNIFFKALEEDEDYELVDPHTKKVTKKLKAKEVWDQIAKGAWTSGDPGMIFIDRINESPANPIRKAGWEVESTNPCVTGETLVSTEEGLIAIKKLAEIGFANVLVDPRLGTGFHKVKVFETGIKDVYKLTTKEGYEVNLTTNHKIYTNKGWKEARKLKEDDRILISSIKGGFGKEGTLEEGEILGWLVGDGTIKATEAVLSFFGREKMQLAPKFAQMVNTLANNYNGSQKHTNAGIGWVDERDEARVGSTRLWKYAFENGIKPREKLIVPERVLIGNEDMQKGFMSALFTADGHVEGSSEKGLSVRLTSISLPLLKNVQRMLINFAIASKIYTQRRKESLRSMPDGKGGKKDYFCKEYHDLVISKENLWKFAKEIGFLVDFKNAKLIDGLKEYSRGTYKEKYEVTFKELTYIGKEVVYDLTEPNTHSFLANGIISHNCGEQPLYPFDACNLGSIFLKYFIKEDENGNKAVDWDKLKTVTHTAVRLLDSVIEMNPFPLPQIADTVHKIRRIGLGVGGWADMLVALNIPYDSDEAINLAEKVMKFINEEGHKESQMLAEERGAFPLVKDSIYKDAPMRNSTVTTIAPTGTIGILANNYSGVEPMFAIAYQHIVKSENRTLNFIDPYFEEVAKKRGFYTEELMKKVVDHGTIRDIDEIPDDVKKVFGTAHEIHPDWHIKMQAAFQKYTDNAVSKTINLPNNATIDDIKAAYKLAWETGCRGITVFRDGCKNEQVLNLGVKKESVGAQLIAPEIKIKPRPIKVEGATYKIETPMGHAFITVNQDADGNPFEVFIAIGKAGSEVAAMAEAMGRLISTTLRHGNHVTPIERAKELVDQMQGIGGGNSVGFGPNKVRSLPDAVAKAIAMHFGLLNNHKEEIVVTNIVQEKPIQLTINQPTSKKKFDLCPSCGNATLVFEEGCKKCHSCGYSEC